VNSFDGNSSTFWHTRWYDRADPLPHEIQIDLGASYALSGFRYLPRQDGSPNGRIGTYEFYVSSDGSTWGTPVATGTFRNDATEKQVAFTAKTGRYIRLRALSEVNGYPYTSAAAIKVVGSAVSGPSATVIPHTHWALRYVDSQDTLGGNYAAVNSFDGSTTSFWHTRWYGAIDPLPHEIQIDLGATYAVSSFRYLPRQDGNPNGRIGKYEFYVSTDGVNWGTPVVTGTLVNDATEKQVSFTAKTGRYVRLRALTEANGLQYTSMAEFNVVGVAQ
jgi:endo-alpha-N-acetylgalactosaminidase